MIGLVTDTQQIRGKNYQSQFLPLAVDFRPWLSWHDIYIIIIIQSYLWIDYDSN